MFRLCLALKENSCPVFSLVECLIIQPETLRSAGYSVMEMKHRFVNVIFKNAHRYSSRSTCYGLIDFLLFPLFCPVTVRRRAGVTYIIKSLGSCVVLSGVGAVTRGQ